MERGISTKRSWVGVALELSPYALFELGLRFESAWWRRSDLLYDIGVALFCASLVSGLGWVAVGHHAGALAAFAWRALFVTILGAAMWMDSTNGGPWRVWVQFGWFASMAFPMVSALLLWRWWRSPGAPLIEASDSRS